MLGRWEEFEEGPTVPREKRMHVTLSPRSVIHLSGNVFEKLGKPKFVRLLFDRLNSTIGVLPTDHQTTNAFPVKTKGSGRNRIIWASPFCRYWGIHFDTIRAFARAEIDQDGILRLDLRETTAVGRRTAKRHDFSSTPKY